MLTANQKRIRVKYTRIEKIGGKWSTLLSVGVQSFHVVENTTKARAKMFADMLSIALDNLLKSEAAK